MFAKDLVSNLIPTVKSTDSGNKVIGWMDFYKVSHLPVTKDNEYVGLISESDVYNLDCGEENIGNFNLSVIRPYVYETQHLWEVVSIFSEFKLSLVPVLDEDDNYVGLISLADFVNCLSFLTSADQMGSIIVLEMGVRDYSLSEISRIVEENNAKVLSLFVSSKKDTMLINVTIKLNTSEITSILQTFTRYDYTIKASFLNDDDEVRLYRERYESFLNYLNV